jgi:hypothetical protein
MSEHMTIKGQTEFHHLPYDYEGGMVFCSRCKKITEKPIINLDEGFRVSVVCHRCKKVIWTTDIQDIEKEIIFPKDNEKCSVCRKRTNEYDCVAVSYHKNTRKIFCSRKCFEKSERNG